MEEVVSQRGAPKAIGHNPHLQQFPKDGFSPIQLVIILNRFWLLKRLALFELKRVSKVLLEIITC